MTDKDKMPDEIWAFEHPSNYEKGWHEKDCGRKTCEKYIRADLREWQPIETAPKDGTRICCYFKEKKHGMYKLESEVLLKVFCPLHKNYCSNSIKPNCLGIPDRPTHWMPLPQPPKGEE